MSIVMRRLWYALAVSSSLFLGMLVSDGLEARGQAPVVEPEGRDQAERIMP